MKKVSILAVAALAMFGCSKNVNVNDGHLKNGTIGVAGSIGQLGKGSYTQLDDKTNQVTLADKDKFGVFMHKGDDNSALAKNVLFTYDLKLDAFIADYGSGEGAKLTWEDLLNGGGGDPTSLSFYSYYPHAGAETVDATNITVNIPETQTMGAKSGSTYTEQRTVTAADFLYSEKVLSGEYQTEKITKAQVPADRTVKFQYKHALSIVELNIVKSVSLAAKDVWFDSAKISGTSIYKDGTIDITHDTPTVTPGTTGELTIAPKQTGTDADKLVPETDKNDTNKAKTRYQMLVMPMAETSTGEEAKLELSVKTNTVGGGYAGANPLTVGQSFGAGVTWEAGKRYKYNIIVTENAVIIKLVSIADWEEGEGGDIVTPPTPGA